MVPSSPPPSAPQAAARESGRAYHHDLIAIVVHPVSWREKLRLGRADEHTKKRRVMLQRSTRRNSAQRSPEPLRVTRGRAVFVDGARSIPSTEPLASFCAPA